MFSTDFVRRESGKLTFYTCAALDEMPFLRHGFSTRHGGTSLLPERALNLSHLSWDDAERVEENRGRFLAALGLRKESLITLSQIHSDRVHIIKENQEQWNHCNQGDALVTERAGISLAVQVADCLPILIADPEAAVIGAIHAGWRGSLARIAARSVEAMCRDRAWDPSRLIVAIGPGIRSCCFEVGTEVVEAFEKEFHGARLSLPQQGTRGKYFLDLGGAIRIQLREAGLPRGNIFDLGACTRCNPDEFFSYRGEGHRSGRMMGIIAKIR